LDAKEVLTEIIQSGKDIEQTIVKYCAEGRITEALLFITHERIQLAIQMEQEEEAIRGLKLILQRMQAEVMNQYASPALILLEKVLQIEGDDWEERAKMRLSDAFRGLEATMSEAEAEIVDIFAMAMDIGSTEQSEKKGAEVSRQEFIEALEILLSEAPRVGTEEQDKAIARVEACLNIAKQMGDS